MFTFGVGSDVNVALLEQLAVEGRGTAHFVRPEEDVERAVGVVAARLSTPVLTDARVTVDGVELRQPHPAGALDVFAGQDLVLLARYRGHGPATVRVEGTSPAGPVRWTARATFPERRRDDAFVARLWATQRVGWLSAERRREGPNAELDEELRELGIRYGIPTELSSYLVLEPGMVAGGSVRGRALQGRPSPIAVTGMSADAAAPPAAAPPPPAREWAFEQARTASAQRMAVSLAGAPAEEAELAGRAEGLRRAAGRSFVLRDSVWTDAVLDGAAAGPAPTDMVRVRAYSDGWFALVGEIPELADAFALGERVRVAGRRVVIEVAPEAPERLDAGTLRRARDGW